MRYHKAVTMLSRSLPALCLLAAGIPGVALAQQTNDQRPSDDRKRTTIVIEPDGRVIVDGKEADAFDGGMLRLETADGDVLLLRPGAGPLRSRVGRAPLRFHLEDGAFSPERFGEALESVRVFDTLGDLGAWPGELARFAEESAEVVRMERETRELAGQARRAEGAERTRLERELRSKLAETFEKKLETRRERLARQEGELEEAQDELQRRQRSRDEIIDRRLNELLGERDELEW